MRNMMQTYAGIGSRSTPPDVCARMTGLARALEDLFWVLRSGGAPGADSAFEAGVTDPGMKEIYLPWIGFNRHTSSLCHPSRAAHEIAAQHHPNWLSLSRPVQRLMARNSHQVLGHNLDDPVKFILCWTPNGEGGGGTGQAIRLATARGIPVFDLALFARDVSILDVINRGITSGSGIMPGRSPEPAGKNGLES